MSNSHSGEDKLNEFLSSASHNSTARGGDSRSAAPHESSSAEWPSIARRDFVFGVLGAAGLAAMGGCKDDAIKGATSAAVETTPFTYPPALTGFRGSTTAVMNAGHQVRQDAYKAPTMVFPKSDETYDLIIVGGGISGLTSAHLFSVAQPNARILIIENHDDFGGHARRNEFTVDGKKLVSYGGVEYFDHPSLYNDAAKGVFATLGIIPEKIAETFDTKLYESHGLGDGIFLKGDEYGGEKLIAGVGSVPWKTLASKFPIAPQAQRDLVRLFTVKRNYVPNMSGAKLLNYLGHISYKKYLEQHVKVHPAVVRILQTRTSSLFGLGIDAASALDCAALELPGFDGLKLPPLESSPLLGRTPKLHSSPVEEHSERYHYPDGGASLARLLLHNLIPNAAKVGVGDQLQTSDVEYAELDKRSNRVRVRLNSTAVRVAHEDNAQKKVSVTYARDGKMRTATADRVVLACWHGVIPHMCPELPQAQREAMVYGVKVPLLYTNVALRNWQSFVKAGVNNVDTPNQFYSYFKLDYPVSNGGYQFAKTPDEPIVVNMVATPCQPGLPPRDQYRAGRAQLLAHSFESIEKETRDLLTGVLGPFGFDATRDIAGITANRWAHGYAYEYNYLFDPVWAPGESPAEKARQPWGRIAIANADAGAWAYMDGAIEQASNAVTYLLKNTMS